MSRREDSRSRGPAIVGGLLLIGVGLFFLAVQTFNVELPFDLGRVGWPLYVIAPGVVLLLIGLFLPSAPGIGLTIAGGIVSTVGLLLAYQSSTGHYSSWAYAWALVAPASVGASMVLWGVLHAHGASIRGGLGTLAVGLILFLVGFAFFEGVLNLGGERGLVPLGRQALPVALIAAGVLVIATRLWPRPSRGWGSDWQKEWPTGPTGPTFGQLPPIDQPTTTDPPPPTDRPTSA